MRKKRLKEDVSKWGTYHVMSRVVHGRKLLGPREREVFVRQMWQAAGFCGVEVLTYCVMPNHFHLLVRVPPRPESPPPDDELLRRYALLYPRPTPGRPETLEVLAKMLAQGGQEAENWRVWTWGRMGDLSAFVKILKQRFTIWYNHDHATFGSLWAERFKSVLVEGEAGAERIVAAYIDLNPVRAGLVNDPKEYRHCGYGAAVGGEIQARRGFRHLEGGSWRAASANYRMLLYGMGSAPREGKRMIHPREAMGVMHRSGSVPLHDALRCRWRHFTEGLAIGSEDFLRDQIRRIGPELGWKRKQSPTLLPKGSKLSRLATLQRINQVRDPISSNTLPGITN